MQFFVDRFPKCLAVGNEIEQISIDARQISKMPYNKLLVNLKRSVFMGKSQT